MPLLLWVYCCFLSFFGPFQKHRCIRQLYVRATSITGKIPLSDFISKSRSIATFAEGSVLFVLYLITSADPSRVQMMYWTGDVLWRRPTLSWTLSTERASSCNLYHLVSNIQELWSVVFWSHVSWGGIRYPQHRSPNRSLLKTFSMIFAAQIFFKDFLNVEHASKLILQRVADQPSQIGLTLVPDVTAENGSGPIVFTDKHALSSS